MTQEQIERYEVLREAKHDIEMVLDNMSKEEYLKKAFKMLLEGVK